MKYLSITASLIVYLIVGFFVCSNWSVKTDNRQVQVVELMMKQFENKRFADVSAVEKQTNSVSKNVFSSRKKKVTGKVLPPLDLVLAGTILDRSGASMADIRDINTGYGDYYHVGSRIRDALLIKIAAEEVEFLRSNGDVEKLGISAKGIGYGNELYAKEIIAKYKTPGNILKDVDVRPIVSAGKMNGLELSRISTNCLAAQLGFREKDIIKSIDGYPIKNIKDTFKIYMQLMKEYEQGTIDDVEVCMEREGDIKTLNVKIK